MSGLFGGSNKTQTQSTTQGTSYAPWITNAQQTGTQAGLNMAAPFLQTPNYAVAGFTPDQLKGFDLARGMAQTAFTGSPVRSVGASPTLATATTVGAGDIQAAMNPFLENVIAPTMDKMRREKNSSAAQIGARSASGASFGGSGEALERALLDRNFAENASSTAGQLMAAGYDQATATALANAQIKNATSQFNANLGTDFALRAPTIEDGLATNNQTRQANALQLLLGTGGAQQGLAQTAIDAPWTALQRLLAVTPQVYGSTQTGTQVAPDNSPSGLQQLLGLGLTVGGMGTTGGGTLLGNFLSDENTKTNIQELGTDPDTGLKTYAYDYKSDVEAAERDGRPMGPKRVGPMAQEYAQTGGTTKRISGHLVMKAG